MEARLPVLDRELGAAEDSIRALISGRQRRRRPCRKNYCGCAERFSPCRARKTSRRVKLARTAGEFAAMEALAQSLPRSAGPAGGKRRRPGGRDCRAPARQAQGGEADRSDGEGPRAIRTGRSGTPWPITPSRRSTSQKRWPRCSRNGKKSPCARRPSSARFPRARRNAARRFGSPGCWLDASSCSERWRWLLPLPSNELTLPFGDARNLPGGNRLRFPQPANRCATRRRFACRARTGAWDGLEG